ncbi:MAG TPA: formyltransferase family protein [Chitinophagaceae bacterium]|jgi:methionyl-tRNA formyltransferase|nr:formyltransferase family protein [Chitinophagaceae bacterium]
MSQQKIMLLCGGRFAFSVMRDLLFHQQLAVIVIPANCDDMIGQTKVLLESGGSNVPVEVITKATMEDSLKKIIKEHEITMGLMATFSYKIPASVYSLTPGGFFNIHPGPLPGYRGPDPVFWQMRNKEPFAEVCIHKVADDFDNGAVVISERIKLLKNDTYGLLITKLSEVAARLVGILLKLAMLDAAIPSRNQDESKAVWHKKQLAGDIIINWDTMDADTIIATINACNPWNKGAATKINNMVMRLVEAEKSKETSQAVRPGTIIKVEGKSMSVATINNEVIDIYIIYTDHGFMNGGRLSPLGIGKGTCFQSL